LRHLNVLPRFLLNVPAGLRLWIVILCAAICQIIFILLAPVEQNPLVLALPIAVAAWIYRKPGAFLCLVILTVITWTFFAIRRHSLLLSRSMSISFIIGVLTLLLIGLLISMLRDLFDRAEANECQLSRAYEEEQRLHQAKNQFIQHVNHELRTPLTALSGCLELLLEHNEHFDAETRANFLQNAMSSCEELQLLVNNVLESLQVSDWKTEIPLKEISLAPLVREVIQQADPRWQLDQRTWLDIPENMVALAYPQYLRLLMRNLLSNAIKYAPGKQPIVVKASTTENAITTQPEICVSVKDSGPGLPADEVASLFGQFVRLRRDMLGQIRGSGLGLYICKQLVEAMGGRIWVDSTGIPGEGSCFSFTLPAIRAQQVVNMPPQQVSQLAGQPL
jgi:signal transduction histidine kinase